MHASIAHHCAFLLSTGLLLTDGVQDLVHQHPPRVREDADQGKGRLAYDVH